ncbi:hypothetical protein SLE2022_358610 [Rubroshorea leprosula]
MKNMDSKKPIRNLTDTIHSLLGVKSHLTSAWVKSVCDIIKNLPHERSRTDVGKSKDDKSGTDISKIKEELATLTASINQLNIQRRQILNELLDLKGNIRVFCRIRPITLGENFGRLRPVVALDSSNVHLKLADNKTKSYSFDKVFHPGSSQDEVFSEVEPVIKSVLDGYNACIFAYGQTGTGKTFTMEGTPDSPGIVPRATEALFKQAGDSNHAFIITFSMLEIYLGNLKDLLVPQPTKPTDPLPPCLSIQTDPNGGIEIENIVVIQVNDINQALKLYRLGCRSRSTATTNSNATSSRSHCMIRISITCFDAPERRRETNKIWLVDLGGSERVMKTKAWGRRLDEGKAINLSLSALGDVINALQRKKCHIPYRNSKLTQVLRDSLGEDSKTLMLVHVSPKEEDLCETICSLNFATRVKSVHLGHEESTEIKSQKENEMMNLQQKMEKIEDERLHLRRQIKKLNEKVENLTGTAMEEQLEASHFSTQGSFIDLNMVNKRNENVKPASSFQLPRFMRSTICSRRKSGMDHQTSSGRDRVFSKSRRPLSHRAESVTLPVKNYSGYKSDCSISKSTCMLELNMKTSADNETEYSQDASECDIKMIVCPEKEKSHWTTVSQKGQLGHLYSNGGQRLRKSSSKQLLKVDNWLDLSKNEPPISGYAPRNKQVLAIPLPEKKHGNRGQKTSTYSLATEKIVNQNNMERQFDIFTGGRTVSGVVTDKPPTLKDLLDEESRSSFIIPSHATNDQTLMQSQDLLEGLSMEDDECGSPSLSDISCGGLQENDDENEVSEMYGMQAVKDTAQCSEGSMLKNSGHQFSPSELDNSIIDSKEDTAVFTPESEEKWHCEEVHSKLGMENSREEDTDASSESSSKGTIATSCRPRSQKTLFMDDRNQELTVTLVKSQGITQRRGSYNILKHKVQLSCATALLGLGLLDLGFDDNFFYGLML